MGTGGRRGALRVGTGREVLDRRRALVEVSMTGAVAPVEEMDPVEAERPLTCGSRSLSSVTGF